MPRMKKRGPGRPAGAKNAQADQVDASLTACKRCQSVNRSDYYNIRTVPFAGVNGGRRYTRIVLKRTKCLNCGQVRDDRYYQTDTPDTPDDKAGK